LVERFDLSCGATLGVLELALDLGELRFDVLE
jgi:hypothetical protein